MSHVKLSVITIGTVLALMTGAAHAGLLGHSVTSQYYAYGSAYSGYGSPTTFVANGTVQSSFCTSGCPEGFNLTVTDNQIEYDFVNTSYWSSSGPSYTSGGLFIANGNLLTIAGVNITGVTLDASSTMPSFTSSNVTFNSGAVAADWAGISGITAGDKVVLDVTTAAVPEPETYALMMMGLGFIGLVAKRKREA